MLMQVIDYVNLHMLYAQWEKLLMMNKLDIRHFNTVYNKYIKKLISDARKVNPKFYHVGLSVSMTRLQYGKVVYTAKRAIELIEAKVKLEVGHTLSIIE
jgi:hypothetical protein